MGFSLIIERKEYLDKLIAFKDKNIVKIITGIRRCGKSTLMELFQTYLKNNGVSPERIIHINLEDMDYEELLDYKKLYSYIKERLSDDEITYVFLDEIQNIDQFPRVIDSLFIKKNVDLYVTGSNSNLLSSEIATLISGRYVEISMLPLSFKEYIISTGDTNDLERKYSDYLVNSSFPYTLEMKNQPKEIRDYLNSLYNTIVLNDIIERKKVTDVLLLKSVTRFIFDSIGSQLSTKKIADTMTSTGRKVDARTVEKYIDALMESYVIYQAKRYNIRGKEHLKTLEKYYVVDIGLRYMLLGARSTDVGHMLENIVYLELLRRGYDVSVGKIDDLEVDFVAHDGKTTEYYQVAATVREESTLKRELASLQRIKDHYPKILLTLDNDPDADYDGIRRINVLKWLIGEE